MPTASTAAWRVISDTRPFLLDSAFHQLERIGIVERRRIPVERLVDRVLSVSSTSPTRLGLRVDELAARVRELAFRYADGDLVTEVVESTALIAKRLRTHLFLVKRSPATLIGRLHVSSIPPGVRDPASACARAS